MEDRIITQEDIKILKQHDKYGLIGTLLYKRKLGVELFKEDKIRLENLAIESGIITENEELIDRGDRFIIRKIIEEGNIITDKTSETSEINPRLLINEEINEDINESLESDIEELQNNGIQYGRSYLKPIDEPFGFRSMYTVGTEEQIILELLEIRS